MSRAQRRNVRKKVSEAIVVSNAINGESMGRIGNLSIDGMMLIGTQAFHEEYYYQFQFTLNCRAQAPQRVEVGVQCLWAEQARTGRSFWGGFKVIDLSEGDIKIMNVWIGEQAEEA